MPYCKKSELLLQLRLPLQDNRIRPFTMPLMSLAATAIDQPKSRQKVTDTMLQYLDTDAICCREEPGKLANQQAKVWLVQLYLRKQIPAQLLSIHASADVQSSACLGQSAL